MPIVRFREGYCQWAPGVTVDLGHGVAESLLERNIIELVKEPTGPADIIATESPTLVPTGPPATAKTISPAKSKTSSKATKAGHKRHRKR